VIERHDSRLEADVSEEPKPRVARKQAFDVTVPLDLNGSIRVTEDVRVIDNARRVIGIGIP
jgi:hypothetical protein